MSEDVFLPLYQGAYLTADPGVPGLILARSHTFVEIVYELISTAILPSADYRRVSVNFKLKYVHKVLVNRLVELKEEKSVVRWTDHPDMTIAVNWDKASNQRILYPYKQCIPWWNVALCCISSGSSMFDTKGKCAWLCLYLQGRLCRFTGKI